MIASMRNGTVRWASSTPARIASFVKKPGSGHTPASARVPTTNGSQITGCPRRPPMRNTSLVWNTWMTTPAPRNSRALNTPWANRCWNPASGAAAPAAAIM